MFLTKWGEPVSRVLAAYPPGPGLIAALETLIRTAEDVTRTKMKDELAAQVCEGLHGGEPSGLKCRACYEAEQLIPMEMTVAAEIAMAGEKILTAELVDED